MGTKLKAIDFFCGAGGMTYGLKQSGIKVIAGIDIDERCKETYEKNNPESLFILQDIRKLSDEKLKELTGIKPLDDSLIFVGCSPCQYWTHINTDRTKSSESKNSLKYFQKFIKYFLPGFIIIENVQGILKKKKESKIDRFFLFLGKNNYAFDYSVINANHYGVPQNRNRFLLVASRVNRHIKLPKPNTSTLPVVKDFIGTHNGFPEVPAGYLDNTTLLHTTTRLSENNLERLRATPKNGGTRLAWKDNDKLQLPTYQNKDNTFRDTYGRMFWNKPAPTLTTKFCSISNGRFAHPDEHRGISLREGATLQTFPKDYIFIGTSISSIARQIGNAVPPAVAKSIGSSMINSFSKKN